MQREPSKVNRKVDPIKFAVSKQARLDSVINPYLVKKRSENSLCLPKDL